MVYQDDAKLEGKTDQRGLTSGFLCDICFLREPYFSKYVSLTSLVSDDPVFVTISFVEGVRVMFIGKADKHPHQH